MIFLVKDFKSRSPDKVVLSTFDWNRFFLENCHPVIALESWCLTKRFISGTSKQQTPARISINISYTTSYFLLQTDKLPPLLIQICSLSRQSLLSALCIIRTMKLLHPTSKMKRAFFHISCLLFISALQFKYGE